MHAALPPLLALASLGALSSSAAATAVDVDPGLHCSGFPVCAKVQPPGTVGAPVQCVERLWFGAAAVSCNVGDGSASAHVAACQFCVLKPLATCATGTETEGAVACQSPLFA